MEDADVTAVLAEAERLLEAAGEAAWQEFLEVELPPLTVKVHAVIESALEELRAAKAKGEPLSVTTRDMLARLYDQLEQLRAVLSGEVPA